MGERPPCCSPCKPTNHNESPCSPNAAKVELLLRLMEATRMTSPRRDQFSCLNTVSPAKSYSSRDRYSHELEHTDELELPADEQSSPGAQSANSRRSSLSWGLSSSHSYEQLCVEEKSRRKPYLASGYQSWYRCAEDTERPDSPMCILDDDECA